MKLAAAGWLAKQEAEGGDEDEPPRPFDWTMPGQACSIFGDKLDEFSGAAKEYVTKYKGVIDEKAGKLTAHLGKNVNQLSGCMLATFDSEMSWAWTNGKIPGGAYNTPWVACYRRA